MTLKISHRLLIILIFFYAKLQAVECVKLVYPKNNVNIVTPSVLFSWNPNPVRNSFKLEIAYNEGMTNPVVSVSTTASTYLFNLPYQDTTYYWRVFDETFNEYSSIYKFDYFLPNNISNLAAWYKADDGVTVSSGKVTEWKDKSGNNHDLTQSTSSYLPTFNAGTNRINNMPTVKFDGDAVNPDHLVTASAISLSSFNIFIFRNREPATGFLEYIFTGLSNGLISDGSNIGSGIGCLGLDGSLNGAPTTTITNQFSLFSNSNKKMLINNFNIPSSTWAYGGTINGLNLTTLGAREGLLQFNFKGDIAEVIAYAKNTSDLEDTAVYNYTRGKYAPPVNLGPDTVFGNSFCDTLRISAGNRFMSYLWSTGETTSSIKATANGTYSVKVKDVFGVESTDYVTVLPYRRLKNCTAYICKGDTLKLDLKLPPTFSAQWTSIGINSTKVNLTQNGTYPVLITGPGGCTFRDTINLVVNQTNFSPAVVNKNLRICEGEKLFYISNIPFSNINWTTGSTQNFTTFTTNGQYFVTATTTTGCVVKDTVNVTVAGKAPVANFDFSSTCQNTSINFTDLSSAPATNTIQSWSWTFSNNFVSNEQNPSTSFSTLGNATAALKIITNVGCSDSISRTFIINKNPKAQFYNLLSCAGIPTTFVDQSVANSASITDWNWNFGGLGSIAGINNPSFKFPSAGDYNVQLTVTNSNGCREDTTILTTVEVAPIADFSYDSVCGKTPVTFKFLGTVAPPNTIPNLSWGKWDFGDNQIETAIKSPQHVYNAPGTYEVKLIVNSSNQCVDTVVKQVKVFDFPVVDFNVSQTQCVGKEIQFTDISATPDGTPINTWNWFFSGQSTSDEQNPRYTFNEEGNYIIQLTAKNSVGCTGTKLRSIAVSSLPTPKFTFSPQNGLPPLCVTYTNQSPFSGNYLWSYGDGGPLVEAYNPPQHCYNTIGTYPIKLIATDFRGCTDTLTKFILVDKAYLDGVMTSITIIPTNGDFYKIQVSIKNNSNIQITDLGLSLQLGGGSVIRENWTGSLLPGQTTVYLFTGEIKLSENNQSPIVCASIDNVNNNAPEDRTDNNTTCKEVKVGNFDVFNIYPNPAFENINFGVMLPKDGRVTIRFIDILGQLMYNKDFDGLKGYNNFQMSTMPLNAAVYVAEIYYDGQIIRKKFMRKDRK